MDELQMEHRVTAVEKLAGSNRHRLEDIEKRQDNLDDLVASVAVFAKEQEHIQADVKEIKADVKALTDKPPSPTRGGGHLIPITMCIEVIR